MKPYYQEKGITIYHGDCREILPSLPKVDLVLTDPPYNGVLQDEWDNQWASDADFLSWLDNVLTQIDARLAANGTLYLFAAPRLASRVELQIATRFSVIASAVWDKGTERNGAAGSGIDLSSLRTYWSANTERVVVAEKAAGDQDARAGSGYWNACDAVKRSVFGDYLRGEMARAGVTNGQVASLFPSKTGGVTGCVSNWLLGANVPTASQYQTIREFLNSLNCETYLSREYEDLRREYEDLRRPFYLTEADQWGDVWRFGIERQRLHPAQKPLGLMRQVIRVSSRAGATILDPFMGSGTTLRAAKDLGRKAIGIEIEERYCEIAAKRLSQQVLDFVKTDESAQLVPSYQNGIENADSYKTELLDFEAVA